MKILLFPIGGLANRMRAIESAVNFSEFHNCKLNIHWIRDNGLNCKFKEIWFPIPYIKDTKGLIAEVFFYLFRRFESFRMIMKFLDYINFIKLYIDQYVGEKEEIYNYIKSAVNNRNYCFIVIKTCENFFPTHYFRNDLFKLHERINDLVDLETKKFDTDTVGVHIRRSDHRISIENSPVEQFEKFMQKELESIPTTKFYLATDDEVTKIYFRNNHKWINKVIVPEGCLNRNSRQGIIQAVVELYSLAKTRKIYGSYWSSFSEMASKIGGNNLEIVTKNS